MEWFCSSETKKMLSPRLTSKKLNHTTFFSPVKASARKVTLKENQILTPDNTKIKQNTRNVFLSKVPMWSKYTKEEAPSYQNENELRSVSPFDTIMKWISPRNVASKGDQPDTTNRQPKRRFKSHLIAPAIQFRRISGAYNRHLSPFPKPVDEITLKVWDAKSRRGCNSPVALRSTLGKILSMKEQ